MDSRDNTSAVKEIQRSLQTVYKDGYNVAYVGVDGIYGERTEAAVTDFQREVGLAPTGIVDLDTWNALKEAARNASERSLASLGITPFERKLYNGEVGHGEESDLVTVIQIMLKTLIGYELGEVVANGIFGDETEDAILDFQRINGIAPTGVVDKTTWNALARAYNAQVGKDH